MRSLTATRDHSRMYQGWHKTGMAVALYIDFTKKWHFFVECNEPEHASPNLERMRELFRERTGDNYAQLSIRRG